MTSRPGVVPKSLWVAVLCAPMLLAGRALFSQGVATASVFGTVTSSDATDIDGANVTVLNGATGFSVRIDVRRGRFLAQGLEIGGPYTVTVRKLGFHPERRDGLALRLGEPLELHFVLHPAARSLDTLRVASATQLNQTSPNGGTATTITDSLLHRLPTLNRNMYDFVRLVPQISTRTGFRTGFSGGGVGLRYNNYLINGVSERSTFFNSTAAFGAGRSVPLEAVKEYQVLLSPYDVRFGDFAGALVNTVTRSGTNQLEGSVFGAARNDRLARADTASSATSYERAQYGFSLGGPIVRDRLHFFVAPEFQRFTSPAAGPYAGQSASSSSPLRVREADLTRLDQIMRKYGLEAGSGGPVENSNPLAHMFARLDLAIPARNTRGVVWTNLSRFSASSFSRPPSDSFPLSTFRSSGETTLWFTSLQLHTALPSLGGAHNEFVVSHNLFTTTPKAVVDQPIVRVAVPSTTGGTQMLVTGTPLFAQEGSSRERVMSISDNLTMPLGASHIVTLGMSAEPFRYDRGGRLMGSYGTWTFDSLDSLDRGETDRFEVVRDMGSGSVPIGGTQYAAYVSDRWLVDDRLTVTLGVRADHLAIRGSAPYNADVDAIFGRRTDGSVTRRVVWSPRAGFIWDVAGNGRDQLRGGIGLFAGRPPATWIHASLASYGSGSGRLVCGTGPGTAGGAPAFVPNYRAAPTACVNGARAGRGDVDLLDGNVDMIRTLRASFAWDRRLPWDMLATGEVLITRNLSDLTFVNRNLVGPQAVDRTGRVMYGTISASGTASPKLRSTFPEVIDLTTTSRNHAHQLSARIEKQFTQGTAATASYTYSYVRDVSTPVRTGVRGTLNWAARAVSGRQDDSRAGVSLNDVPHRVVVAGNYRAPWRRWWTEVAFYYVGESGSPFTYVAGGAGPLGDLNADGADSNDPIYVPSSAFDTTQIRFSGRSNRPGDDNSPAAQARRISEQQSAFDQFVRRTPCLDRQRGRVMARNSCRDPWSNTSIASLRQAVPVAGRTIEAELQLFNVLNLVRSSWGQYRVANASSISANASLLEHVEQTSSAPDAQSVFRFTAPTWATVPAESRFQLQAAVRYRF